MLDKTQLKQTGIACEPTTKELSGVLKKHYEVYAALDQTEGFLYSHSLMVDHRITHVEYCFMELRRAITMELLR